MFYRHPTVILNGRGEFLVVVSTAPTPPLKWAGGKRWLVPIVKNLYGKHRDRRLVEPLCGGLAIAMGLSPTRILANDANEHAMHFYRWLQRGLRVALPMENSEAAYYTNRDRFNELVRSGKAWNREASELFYYLNRTGYNGLCRFNRRGEFNVPFGRYSKINYREEFSEYRTTFANWEFTTGDFESVLLTPDDFVYADPPYDVPFTQYSPGGFDWSDQVRLASLLARHPGPVVLSNQATPRIVSLYESLGYDLTYLDAPRRISCTGDRTPAKEVLATRNV